MATESGENDLQKMSEILCRLVNRETVEPDEDIYQAGLTSIMVLPLLAELEQSFQVTIPDSEFLDARTPTALAQLIARLRTA